DRYENRKGCLFGVSLTDAFFTSKLYNFPYPAQLGLSECLVVSGGSELQNIKRFSLLIAGIVLLHYSLIKLICSSGHSDHAYRITFFFFSHFCSQFWAVL